MMSEQDETTQNGKSEEENISWKATNGNGKSIYDCENGPGVFQMINQKN